mgnify:CR=1 FL=1
MKFMDNIERALYVDANEDDINTLIVYEECIEAISAAIKRTNPSGICCQSVEAVWRNTYAKEIAAMSALIETLEKNGFEIVRIKT